MIPFDFFYNVYFDKFFSELDISMVCPRLGSNLTKFSTEYPLKTQLYPVNESLRKDVIIFYDQEPVDVNIFYKEFYRANNLSTHNIKLVVTSEVSRDEEFIQEKFLAPTMNYFYHGLLCPEWYRNYWYTVPDPNLDFEHVYITYNNLVTWKRLYRANLLVELHNRNLTSQGLISFKGLSKDELALSLQYTLLPAQHKEKLVKNSQLLEQKIVLDDQNVTGHYSSAINIPHIRSAFVNVVTETVFYENKQHLTEKIFKPIVAKMPFLLLAGARNLEYLRSYGFKTFGDYWDESYDLITNNSDRFDAVLDILERLCSLPMHELVSMKKDMRGILEHNFNHFYRNLRPLVATELTTKLGNALSGAGINYNASALESLKQTLIY